MSNTKEQLRPKAMSHKSFDEILESTPHTQIELPTGGIVYPKDSVLSKGVLHMRYLKGKDEEVLLSPSNIKNKSFQDLLLKQVILEPEFDPKDLTIGDKVYCILACRISSLGDEYVMKKIQCQNSICGHVEENYELKISESIKDAPMIHQPVEPNTNSFEVTLPVTKDVVTMKTLTGHIIDNMTKKGEALERVGQEFTTMNTYAILINTVSSIDDPNPSEGLLLKYVRDLPLRDTNKIRTFLSEIRMTPDPYIDWTCPVCGTEQEVPVSFGFDFFFPEY